MGGGRGIGRSTSLILAHAGCDVGVADINSERGESVVAEARSLGSNAEFIRADVSTTTGSRQMVSDCIRILGKVDIVANIVGGAGETPAPQAPALDYTETDWDMVQQINTKYVFFVCQTAARHIIERQGTGSFINLASINGWESSPNMVAYGVAKAGIINLTKTLATEWGSYGIRVNAISPAAISTPRTRAAFGDPEFMAKLSAVIPLQRHGATDEIAAAVLFLASDLSSFITGQTIPVDGGRTAAYRGWVGPK